MAASAFSLAGPLRVAGDSGRADLSFRPISSQSCNVCSAPFPSRSKLFDHIKATGHALADGQDVLAFGGKKAGKKGRR